MNLQQAQKHLSELEPYLNKLTSEIETAERRKSIAENTASSLEERNKSVIEGINKEAKLKKQTLEQDFKLSKSKIDKELVKAEGVKKALLDEIEAQLQLKQSIIDQIQVLVEDRDDLNQEVTSTGEKLADLQSKIIVDTNKSVELQSKVDSFTSQLRDLSDSQSRGNEDLEILNNEIEVVENKLLDLDTDYKERKKYLEGQLKETQTKLKDSLDSLQEAQNKDKSMRELWAEEQMKLDKREATVRRMESKVSDAESRIEELGRYDRL